MPRNRSNDSASSPKKEKRQHFTMIPNYVVRSDDRPNVVRVLAVIASYAWEGSSCTASAGTIGRDARVSRDTVFAAIKLWEQRGQIQVDRSDPRGSEIVTTFDYQFDYLTDAPWVSTKRMKRVRGLKQTVLKDGLTSQPTSTTEVPGEALPESAAKDVSNPQASSPPDLGGEHKEDTGNQTKDERLINTHPATVNASGGEGDKGSNLIQVPGNSNITKPEEELCQLFVGLNLNPKVTHATYGRSAKNCLTYQPLEDWSDLLHRYAKCKEASATSYDRWLPLIRNPKELLEKFEAFIDYETRAIKKRVGMIVSI